MVSTNPSIISTSASTVVAANNSVLVDDSQPGPSKQSGTVKVTNDELKQVLEHECEALRVQLSEAEARNTLENIYKL